MAKDIFSLGFDRNQAPIGPVNLPCTGVPEWLNGSFIRNGPGLFYIGEQRFNHWFDGLGMLHKFDFDRGAVSYHSKFLECNATDEALSNKELTYSEFATDPCWSIFGKMRSLFKTGPTDSAKVNLAKIGEEYFALGETTMQLRFDPETLGTLSRYNFNQPKFGTSSTAHPHVDGGEAFNLVTKYGPVNYYQILKMNAEADKVASINTLTPSYQHSFGMSKKYFIIAESPFTVQSIKLVVGTKPFINNFHWHSQRGTRVWVVDRHTGKTVFTQETEPFFFFHFVNSMDTDSGVDFDIVTYPDANIIEAYYLDKLSSNATAIPGGTLTRFTVDLESKTIEQRQLSSERIELSHIDYDRFNTRTDYQFVYATGLAEESSKFYDQLVKIDTRSGGALKWSKDDCYPGEPVFVAHPDSDGEDAGLLLSLVIDVERESSFLLMLDAHTFEEVTRVEVPDPILAGFHGNYFPKQVA